MPTIAQGSRYSSRPSFSPGPVNVLPMNKSELVVSSPDASDKYYNYSENPPRNFLMSPPTSFYNTALSSSGLSASSLASYSLGASSKVPTHSPTHSLTYLLTHSYLLTHLLTHSPTYSLTHLGGARGVRASNEQADVRREYHK